jgi:hypothetical protein
MSPTRAHPFPIVSQVGEHVMTVPPWLVLSPRTINGWVIAPPEVVTSERRAECYQVNNFEGSPNVTLKNSHDTMPNPYVSRLSDFNAGRVNNKKGRPAGQPFMTRGARDAASASHQNL